MIELAMKKGVPIAIGTRFHSWIIHSEDLYLTPICKCDCGTTKRIYLHNLLRGLTKSCGCLKGKLISERKITHGQTLGSTTKAYYVWANMLTRCTNPKVKGYNHYGGRGISVCEQWRSFENFYADMGDPPDGLTIDRINNDGNYEPLNCRWATKSEQNKNRRPRRIQHAA